jgi:hypothetical protein
MFRAQSHFIAKDQKQSRLSIKNTELQYFVSNLSMVGSAAALLAGFALSAFGTGWNALKKNLESSGWEYSKPVQTLFLLSSMVSMSASLLAVLHCTLCTMYAPGLALQGPDGSVQRATEGLKVEAATARRLFFIGLFAFIVSAVFMSWYLMLNYQAAIATGIFSLAFLLVYFIFWRQDKLFTAVTRAMGTETA